MTRVKVHSVKIGQHFGSWHVLQSESFMRPDGYYAVCECNCGKRALVQVRAMISGKTLSCGCRVVEQSTDAMDRLWRIWDSLPKPRMGWLSWDEFIRWSLRTGYNKKAKLRLRDPEFGYNKTNCYWENARTRNNRTPDYVPVGWGAKP